jgi:hypothetical protein
MTPLNDFVRYVSADAYGMATAQVKQLVLDGVIEVADLLGLDKPLRSAVEVDDVYATTYLDAVVSCARWHIAKSAGGDWFNLQLAEVRRMEFMRLVGRHKQEMAADVAVVTKTALI